MSKDYAREFYNSTAWKECRESYKKYRHGLCERCLAAGRYNPGVVVHHIQPITPTTVSDPEITLSFDNLQLLCVQCHADMHGSKKNRRYIVEEDGTIHTIG